MCSFEEGWRIECNDDFLARDSSGLSKGRLERSPSKRERGERVVEKCRIAACWGWRTGQAEKRSSGWWLIPKRSRACHQLPGSTLAGLAARNRRVLSLFTLRKGTRGTKETGIERYSFIVGQRGAGKF